MYQPATRNKAVGAGGDKCEYRHRASQVPAVPTFAKPLCKISGKQVGLSPHDLHLACIATLAQGVRPPGIVRGNRRRHGVDDPRTAKPHEQQADGNTVDFLLAQHAVTLPHQPKCSTKNHQNVRQP
jgi:hypothetical protein